MTLPEDDGTPVFSWPPAGFADPDSTWESLRSAIFKHPAAARGFLAALVEEGKRFAETPEGGVWKTRLEASPLLPWLHQAFDTGTLRLLQDEPGALLPSTLMDALFSAALELERNAAGPTQSRPAHG